MKGVEKMTLQCSQLLLSYYCLSADISIFFIPLSSPFRSNYLTLSFIRRQTSSNPFLQDAESSANSLPGWTCNDSFFHGKFRKKVDCYMQQARGCLLVVSSIDSLSP
jgi:hypothetical protein